MPYHKHYQSSEQGGSPYAGGSSFVERVSEAVASGMGTVSFLVVSSGIILAWVLGKPRCAFPEQLLAWATQREGFRSRAVHPAQPRLLGGRVLHGALVIIAQKAQTRTDKANEEAAAAHREELAQFQTDLLRRTPT